jgi:hypothetical protein
LLTAIIELFSIEETLKLASALAIVQITSCGSNGEQNESHALQKSSKLQELNEGRLRHLIWEKRVVEEHGRPVSA